MSKFTPLVKKEYEFEGDKVVVNFRRLQRGDMIKLMPLIQKQRDAGDKGMRLEVIGEFMTEISDMVPKYVTGMSGLTAEDGTEISVETMAAEVYFLDLQTSIAMDLLNESMVGGGSAAKNG